MIHSIVDKCRTLWHDNMEIHFAQKYTGGDTGEPWANISIDVYSCVDVLETRSINEDVVLLFVSDFSSLIMHEK